MTDETMTRRKQMGQHPRKYFLLSSQPHLLGNELDPGGDVIEILSHLLRPIHQLSHDELAARVLLEEVHQFCREYFKTPVAVSRGCHDETR